MMGILATKLITNFYISNVSNKVSPSPLVSCAISSNDIVCVRFL